MADARTQGRWRMVATWFAAAGDGLRRAGYEQWLREERTMRKEHRMAGLPQLAVYGWQSMEEALGKSLGIRRILGAVLAFFAAVALVLAVGGLYGVLSYVVGRRRGELGLRMALGARPGQVVGLVVNQGVRLAAIGWLLGTPLVFWLGRMLGDRLVGVRPFEPVVVGAVAAVIVLTGIVASAVPGRRAAVVEPRATLLAD